MATKQYSMKQIVGNLREIDKLQGQGMSIVQACKRLGISDVTYFP